MRAQLRRKRVSTVLAIAVALVQTAAPTVACCPAPPSGKPVVNTDQAVIILWDAANQTQHFIRKASFASEADNFGFLIPSPTEPVLAESGNDAFPFLQKVTEPEIVTRTRPSNVSCGCGSGAKFSASKGEVRVLQQKEVAGFEAFVLEADTTAVLADWLKQNQFEFSSAVEAWAKPYVEQHWKLTALKMAKPKDFLESKSVAAETLRMSFKTARPLFPYREPESATAAETLGVAHRLLRIYFLAEGRYEGALTKESPWTGEAVWANELSAADRKQTLELLKLPETTGPAQMWLTEFEDHWPYRTAPADLYFSKSAKNGTLKRDPIIQYVSSPLPTDVTFYAIVAIVALPPLLRKKKKA